MYVPLNTKSMSLAGLTDLTVIAPIKPGLVPSLDSITYKSRLRRLMEVLQLLRQASHEFVPFRPISDSAERVGRIHSFRVAIVEPGDKLLLAVTFDGARESYVRVLWQKIGTLLDLLFCNTVGHVPAYGRSMADWDAWINGIQIKTDFFYGRPRLAADDVQFLRDEEQARRSALDATTATEAEFGSVRRSEPTAEMRAWAMANDTAPRSLGETARQGIQTIALLHRLTAWFIPGTPDGDFLQRAARDLIPEFTELVDNSVLMRPALDDARSRFREAIDWFMRPYDPRQVPALPTDSPDDQIKEAVQSGILESYSGMTHGALLLLAFKRGANTSAFWSVIRTLCVSAKNQPIDERTVWNVALTYEGLRAAGLSETELAEFPLEFRQGMEARSSVLGDLWINHPDRWRRPKNVVTREPIEMSAVHVVVQLRCGQSRGMAASARVYDLSDPKHPLHTDYLKLLASVRDCVDLLAVQPLVRHTQDPDDTKSPSIEHFGYVDGSSDPTLDPKALGEVYRGNLVHPGEFLVGLANAADAAAGEGAPQVSDWLRLGSFLVLRTLSQDVPMFDKILEEGARTTKLSKELLAGKLAGRMRDGDPLAMSGAGNDFVYDVDPAGAGCPFHAHIRRANPRLSPGTERPMPTEEGMPQLPPGARLPRIMRRGMSFGGRYSVKARGGDQPAGSAGPERGTCFMAYNARIGEQFEVIQRWLAGGNSTGGFSGRSDPLIGVAMPGERRIYAFEHADAKGSRVHRLPLDGNEVPTVLADPLVRLEWGAYLFTPSMAALEALERRGADVTASTAPCEWPWSPERGRAAIERLQSTKGTDGDLADAWKAALEDPEALKDFSAASIWAAIRCQFGGVLRTPYGVLAASHAHANAVLVNSANHYSVDGYRERSAPTLGEMYLGLDDLGPSCPYRNRSTAPNRAIRGMISETQAFDAARALTRNSIDKLIERERQNATTTGDPTWQLVFAADEVWDDVLSGLCRQWFGLPDAAPFMVAGRFQWDWRLGSAVPYPGHFLSPSRYIFQPRPGGEVARVGSLHGTAVNTAFRGWVTSLRDKGLTPTAPDGTPAPLGRAFFDALPRPTGGTPEDCATQDERLAVILVGALIGFLPTVEGNLRQSLNEWLLDDTFWSERAVLRFGDPIEPASLAKIRTALQRSMMLRPSPEVVWRHATCDHALGPVQVCTGETVVVGIVSATHELLERHDVDEGMVFGGWRAEWPQGSSIPTHACPGHDIAMGTLCGIMTGLLERQEALRPTAFPLSFRMEGDMPAALRTPEELSFLKQAVVASVEMRKRTLSKGVRHVGAPPAPSAAADAAARPLRLLVGGDSWFSFSKVPGLNHSDIIKQLTGVQILLNQATPGLLLKALAGEPEKPGVPDTSRIGQLCTQFAQLAAQGKTPDAVLISIGGNDVVSGALRTYIKDISKLGMSAKDIKDMIAADGELLAGGLENLMDGPSGTMRGQVQIILDKLRAHCKRADGPVPVIWQAYDFPVPDGRNWGLLGPTAPERPTSVLYGPLQDLGYKDLADRAAIMKKVVVRYNAMLAALSQGPYSGQLMHADLTGTLNGTTADNAYRADWDNELHATVSGFKLLADKLSANYLMKVAPGP